MADIYKSKFTGQEIDDILSNASNVANIEANPSGEATEVLTKITIGNTTYSIPEGGEGTVVEGNPSGEATVELTKLKIGNTIYSIPQGGGGGSGVYRHEVNVSTAFSSKSLIFYNDVSTPYTDLRSVIFELGTAWYLSALEVDMGRNYQNCFIIPNTYISDMNAVFVFYTTYNYSDDVLNTNFSCASVQFSFNGDTVTEV